MESTLRPAASSTGLPNYRQDACLDSRRQLPPCGNQGGQVGVNRPDVGHKCCAMRCTVLGIPVFFGNIEACNLIANPLLLFVVS
jgi:hypothetical protein